MLAALNKRYFLVFAAAFEASMELQKRKKWTLMKSKFVQRRSNFFFLETHKK